MNCDVVADQALLDRLWKDFKTEPFDALNGPALADYLEETGDIRNSRMVRWLVKNQRWPTYFKSTDSWDWWKKSHIENNPSFGFTDKRTTAAIPDRLFDFLCLDSRPLVNYGNGDPYTECESLEQALDALATALEKACHLPRM